MKKQVPGIIIGIAVVLAGCGGVITPEAEPTATPSPAATLDVQEVLTAPPPQPTAVVATPIATATPIVHVVQSGETLSGIAAQYGVSVQALQAVNGIENPQFLRIGQALTIPTGEEAAIAESLLLPTPTPILFAWGGVGFYETPVGSLWCLGEVVNTTPYTLTNMQVQVTLYDGAGTPLISGDAFAAADILPPAGRAPFGILFISPPPGFVSNQVAIVRGEFSGSLPDIYVPLAVEEVSGSPSGPQFEVAGTVRNSDPTRGATQAVVVVTLYDGEGRVTGFRQQMVDVGEVLAPGATAPFRLLLTAQGGTVPADWSVIAFGRAQSEE